MRIARMIRDQIEDGTLKPGEPTPSVTQLNRQTGHARQTCSKGLRQLEDAGIITRCPGLGCYVRCSLTQVP
jgi:DNA-binding GntR family transcriptional regulator